MNKVFTSFTFVYSVIITITFLLYLDATETTITQLQYDFNVSQTAFNILFHSKVYP